MSQWKELSEAQSELIRALRSECATAEARVAELELDLRQTRSERSALASDLSVLATRAAQLREAMRKYMEHIGREEGVNYLDFRPDFITQETWDLLVEVSKEPTNT